MFGPAPTIGPHLQGGKVKALAVTTAKRSTLYPDIPTFSESGLSGYDTALWFGLWAPKDTPQPRSSRRCTAAVKDRRAQPKGARSSPSTASDAAPMTADEFGAFVRDEVAKWAKVVEFSGASAGMKRRTSRTARSSGANRSTNEPAAKLAKPRAPAKRKRGKAEEQAAGRCAMRRRTRQPRPSSRPTGPRFRPTSAATPSSPPWGSAASTTCSSIPARRSCSCRRRSPRRTRSGGRRRS